MRLSTKARYAVRAMIELAFNYGGEPVKLKTIADNQDLSIKYLEQVMNPLRVSGYVATQKGSRGGYRLVKPPGHVNLYDLICSVEGSLAPVDCVESPDVCDRVNICVTRDVWVRMHQAITRELQSISLADLVDEQQKLLAES
ncbi:MAG: RrF2 family transcriptional regulator [Bacillota bacterium]